MLQPSLQMLSMNCAVKEEGCSSADGNGLPDAKDDGMKIRNFLTDLPKEGRLAPLKYNVGSDVEKPSRATPRNTTQPPMETALELNGMLWPQSRIWGK